MKCLRMTYKELFKRYDARDCGINGEEICSGNRNKGHKDAK